MSGFSLTNNNNTTAQTLVEDDTASTPATDDSGFIDATSSLTAGTAGNTLVAAISLNLAAAPASTTNPVGIVITNNGTITATAGTRAIDVTGAATAAATATGAMITLDNSGTIQTSGSNASTVKADAFRVNFDMPSGVVVVNNTGTISTNADVSDSVGIRLGKVYSAASITITNGSPTITSAKITTADGDAIRPGGVDPSGANTGFGNSLVVNYGTITASDEDTPKSGVQLKNVNGIDIGIGQSSEVDNHGAITGDESGLGAENGTGGPTQTFAANYIVKNFAGASIVGNDGPAIVSGTATITNLGSIIGKANGVSSIGNQTIATANGTGIYTTALATITNGSLTNTAAQNAASIIQGSGAIGTSSFGGANYDAINIANGTVTNYGIIQESAATAAKAAAAVLISGTIASTVSNYGTITGAAGLAITMGGGNDTVNLYTGESVTGKIDGGAGTDTLTLNLGPIVTTGTLSNVANFEILSVLGGTWAVNDIESYQNGVTIGPGAILSLGQAASLTGATAAVAAAVTDNGAVSFADTGAYTFANTVTGTGTLIQAGAGTLTLGNSADTYSGGTTINSGTLDVAAVQAAGTGTITFGATTPTLAIEQAALTTSGTAGTFSNTLSGFAAGDVIDLKGIGAATAVTYTATTNQLNVTGGTKSVTLQFDATGAAPAGYVYAVTADAGGTGTNVFLDANPTVTSLSASPSSGYEKAGQTFTMSIVTNKAVSVSGNGPTLALSDGGTATYTSSTTTGNATTLVFTSSVASGQTASGLTVSSVSNGASVTDALSAALDFTKAINQAAVGPTIDTTAPTLTITSAAGVINQTTEVITGTSDDTSQPLFVFEGTNATQATYTGGNAWSASVTLSGNGTHTLFAQETDLAGNVGTSGSVVYTLQSTAPDVVFTAAQGGITNQPNLTLTGTVDLANDPEAANTTVTILNGTSSVGTGIVDSSNGNWSARVSLASDGTYSLKASDPDTAGNTGFSNPLGVTLDTTAPDTSITSGPAANASTSSAAFAFTGTDSGTGVASFKTEIDGAAFAAATGATATYANLSDGSHTFEVEAVDGAGNIDQTPAVYTWVVDTTPPDTSITAHPVADSSSGGASFTFSGTDSGTGVVSYKTSLDGSSFASTTGTTASYTGLADGSHTFSVEAVDAAGNVDPTPASYSWTVDTTAPIVTIVNNGGPTKQASQTINGTVGLADANSTVTLSENGSPVTQAQADSQGNWHANITLPSDGIYVVKASDTDGAGNTGSASVTFTLDTVAPNVDFTTADETVYTPEQTVSGTVDTADAGTIVTVYEGSTALGIATVGSSGLWSTSVVLNGAGAHALVAQDTDAVGNTGLSDNVTLTLDTSTPQFTKGNLVLSVYGDSDGSGDYDDNQATPVVLEQVTTDGTFVNQLILPQGTIVRNGVTESVFSGEYGSSSEGSLQLSADGKSLVIAGYAVNAQVYNTGGAAIYGNAALAQSSSLTNQTGVVPIGRVIADIASDGTVDTSTVLFNVYNGNNPRSVATIDGSSFYISGQGISGDTTQGVFYVADGSASPTALYNGTDTRTAEIYNGVLYVSTDSKQPKSGGGTANLASYGALPTSATTPIVLKGISRSVTLTSAQANAANASVVGSSVNLDPENFFFANSTTLYVADGGIPKQGGGGGDGGLQKWTFNGTQWVLDYTLSQGLQIVQAGAAAGTTGLIGLTGKVIGDAVELYATNQTVGDLDQKYLFGITDSISATTNAGTSFTTLVTAAPDTNIRGISFAPTTAAPTVAITSNGGLTDSAVQIVSGTVDLADAGTTVSILENNASLGSVITGIDGTWRVSVTLTGDGPHTLVASDTDQYGNTGTSSLAFTLDTTAPAVTASATAATVQATSAAGATETFTGSATDAVDGTSDPIVYTEQLAGNATKVVASGDTFAIGTHTITASATDAAGNFGTATAFSFNVVDTTAPVVTASPTGVTVQATSAAGATETFIGSATDAVDGTSDPIVYTEQLAGNATKVVHSGDTFALGSHTITASATDAAGNIGSATAFSFTVQDTTAPAVTLVTTPASKIEATGSGGAAVAFAASDTDAVDVSDPIVFTDLVNGVATTVTSGDTFALGSHTITASATDAAGNIGSATAFSFTVQDTTAPAVTLVTTPASKIEATGSGGAAVTFTATDTDAVDGSDPIVFTDLVNGVATTVTSGDTFALGTHTITASATDAAGNIGSATAFSFTVQDTTTPAVTLVTTPASKIEATGSGGAAVTFTASDTDAVDGSDPIVFTDLVNGVATTVTSGDTFALGSHTITASATDAAGNTGSATAFSFSVVDTIAPVVTASATGATVQATSAAGATETFTGSATDAVDGTSDPIVYTEQLAGNATKVVHSGDTFALGTHTITASATDAAGNIGSAPFSFSVVDTIAPVVKASATTATVQATSTLGAVETFIGSATDAVDGTSDPIVYTEQLANGTTATVKSGGTFAVGLHTIVASATDSAANTGRSAAFIFVVTPESIAGGGSIGSTVVQNVDPSLFGSITHDVTSPGGDIYALFETILGRAPDAIGFETLVAAREDGISLQGIAHDLLASAEYTQDHGRFLHHSNRAFVDHLYENAYHRDAGSREIRGWDHAFAQGTPRKQVAADIVRSAESHADLAPTFQAGVFVPSATDSTIARLYYGLLDRQPDIAGLSTFEAAAAKGAPLTTIASKFIHSAEYTGLHGSQSNAQFVEALFESAFGHAEGVGGAQGYLHELNTGASRATVALSLLNSPEAVGHLSPNIETGFHVA